MKKQLLFISALLLSLGTAMGQCTIDANAQTVPGISPTADQMPCIIVGQPFDQTIQVQNLAGAGGGAVNVDSMILTSVTGLPAGITWSKNPDKLYSGQNGCLTFTGTTNAPTGAYVLGWVGTVWATVPFLGAQMYTGDLTRFGGQAFRYTLYVINPGDPCTHTSSVGINEVSPDLDAAMSIYPNPNNGIFEFKLDAGKRVNGEIVVIDITGRIIYTQQLDVTGLYNANIDLSNLAKGLYTLQLRTADGFAAKHISIQ